MFPYIKRTTIRDRVANKRYRTLTYLRFLHLKCCKWSWTWQTFNWCSNCTELIYIELCVYTWSSFSSCCFYGYIITNQLEIKSVADEKPIYNRSPLNSSGFLSAHVIIVFWQQQVGKQVAWADSNRWNSSSSKLGLRFSVIHKGSYYSVLVVSFDTTGILTLPQIPLKFQTKK